jgi:hypothetical protein
VTIFCVLVIDPTINQLQPIASSKDISTRIMLGKRHSCEEISSFMTQPSLLIDLVCSIILTPSCIYRQPNGCFPSYNQLCVERRKSGAYTRAINIQQLKTILTIIKTKQSLLCLSLGNWFVRCFPMENSLPGQFLVNFRLKAVRILANKSLESDQTSVTRTEESFL